MVWSFQYEPRGSSYPRAEIVDGGRLALELEDNTRDGGVSLLGGNQGYSGRRVKPESVPKAIRFLSKRPLQDFENQYIKTVSDRFKSLIEEIEPNLHQFEPVEFIAVDASSLGWRWFWQICHRLDSVHREKTDWVLEGAAWNYPPNWNRASQPVFDISKIRNAEFWHDMHLVSTNLCSDEARERLDAARITGLRYSYRKQA